MIMPSEAALYGVRDRRAADEPSVEASDWLAVDIDGQRPERAGGCRPVS